MTLGLKDFTSATELQRHSLKERKSLDMIQLGKGSFKLADLRQFLKHRPKTIFQKFKVVFYSKFLRKISDILSLMTPLHHLERL